MKATLQFRCTFHDVPDGMQPFICCAVFFPRGYSQTRGGYSQTSSIVMAVNADAACKFHVNQARKHLPQLKGAKLDSVFASPMSKPESPSAAQRTWPPMPPHPALHRETPLAPGLPPYRLALPAPREEKKAKGEIPPSVYAALSSEMRKQLAFRVGLMRAVAARAENSGHVAHACRVVAASVDEWQTITWTFLRTLYRLWSLEGDIALLPKSMRRHLERRAA